jgi:hypothetical protein
METIKNALAYLSVAFLTETIGSIPENPFPDRRCSPVAVSASALVLAFLAVVNVIKLFLLVTGNGGAK